MRMTRLWAVASLALVSAAVAVAAQPCMRSTHLHQGTLKRGSDCEAAFHENHMWPQQYIGPSRRGICQSFDTMIANGWRQHHVMGQHYFDRNTNELTESGQMKVHWILTQAPPNRRTIYIERTRSAEETADRVAAVQELASALATGGTVPEVRETYVRDYGHPAIGVDAVFTGFRANQMAPMLPPSATGAGAGGGAAAAP
ncbi:MAG TPA: hypothetical protein VF175_05835 [Lacipirellula sp.]